MKVQEISIEMIDITGDRSRSLDSNQVAVTAASISERGLLQPIVVKAKSGRFELVFGLHRLTAFRQLGHEKIPAIIREYKGKNEARLDEVMENVMRSELCALDRAHSLFELDRIYKEIYPQLKKGGDKQSKSARKKLSAILSLRSDVLESCDLSQRSFERSVSIWKGLTPARCAQINGTWLAKNQSQLLKLAAVKSPVQQAQVTTLLLEDNPKVNTVDEAVAYLDTGRLPEMASTNSRIYKTLNNAWVRLSKTKKEDFLNAHEESIRLWAKKKGWF